MKRAIDDLAERRAKDAEIDAESRVSDAKEAAETAALEAKMLRETNEELMGFMQELEQASIEATAGWCKFKSFDPWLERCRTVSQQIKHLK